MHKIGTRWSRPWTDLLRVAGVEEVGSLSSYHSLNLSFRVFWALQLCIFCPLVLAELTTFYIEDNKSESLRVRKIFCAIAGCISANPFPTDRSRWSRSKSSESHFQFSSCGMSFFKPSTTIRWGQRHCCRAISIKSTEQVWRSQWGLGKTGAPQGLVSSFRPTGNSNCLWPVQVDRHWRDWKWEDYSDHSVHGRGWELILNSISYTKVKRSFERQWPWSICKVWEPSEASNVPLFKIPSRPRETRNFPEQIRQICLARLATPPEAWLVAPSLDE